MKTNIINFASKEKIYNWIKELCITPHRRTGSEESFQAMNYIKLQFENMGLNEITVEETSSATYEIVKHTLSIEGKEIRCFPINGTMHPKMFGRFKTGSECKNAELVYLNEGRAEDFEGVDVYGKIVLCDCPWFDMNEDSYAQNWCSQGAFIYDPDKNKREVLRKTDSYSPNAWPYNYIMAQQKGAVGFIGVLNDYFSDGINWNEDYSEIAQAEGCDYFEIPGMWIGTDAFKEFKTFLKDNKAIVDMDLELHYDKGIARNIFGILPGMSNDVIIVHSHYDAVFTGAVQDASGMSEVLALADYFSKLPKDERKYTMVFAGLDGHYTDYAGHQLFVKNRLEENKNIICDLVIEHIGKEVGIGKDNEPVISEEPEIRLLYVTNTGNNVEIVKQAILKNDIKRTIVMPVKRKSPNSDLYVFSQDEVISDGYYSDINGIPIISMLSPEMYLFHPMDTPDMIPQEELVPVGVTFAEIIHELFDQEY